MLKEHSQQLREAILAANKAKELAQATKLVGEAALVSGVLKGQHSVLNSSKMCLVFVIP